ncbi:MAG TPA: GH116 family glycosyl hydrolase, partial [Rhodothermales bacterium]|nr:GH116 family glycosyl hydrolase [Rhodothermales bacterium]
FWNSEAKAYLISEPTRQNNAFVGSPAAEGLSYTPAHMLSDQPSEFRIVINDLEAVQDKYIPIALAGGHASRAEVRAVYDRLVQDPERVYRETVAYYRQLRNQTLRIDTPDDSLDLALEWAKVSYDNLVVDHPDHGRGLVAGLGTSGTGGRPGFGWFFGGDAYLNSLSLNSLGLHDTVRDALAFFYPFQREDGKMPHEITQATAYVDWFGDYPYAFIHGDTTPYYLVALYDYYLRTGNLAFVRESWSVAQHAYAWSRATDANGDGLMDNKEAGLGALEFGSLTGIETDIYLGAIWVRSTHSMAQLAHALGENATAEQAEADYAKAAAAFDERFWDEALQHYAYAFNASGDHVKENTPWSAVGLMWGLGTPERTRASLQELSSAELATDWGTRMISNKSARFEPLNYNYGAVWPFLTSWVATAQYQHDRPYSGYALLRTTAQHTFERALGHVTEVFSGARHTWPQESVAHQGFCTAGTVLPLVRGMLGLDGNAPARQLTFAPSLPADWDTLSVTNHKVGDAIFDLTYTLDDDRLMLTVHQDSGAPFAVTLAPLISTGRRVRQVQVNGEPVSFEADEAPFGVRPRISFESTPQTTVEITFAPAPALVLPFRPAPIGAPNQHLKIIDMWRDGEQLRTLIEGRAGKTYTLELVHPGLVRAVTGGKQNGSILHVVMPDGPTDTFVRHEVVLDMISE